MSDLFAQPEFVEPAAANAGDDDVTAEDLEDEDEDETGAAPESMDADDGAEPEDDLDPEPAAEAANRGGGGAAKAVLEHVAVSLVDDPDAVTVEVGPARSGTKLSLHVAPGDMGRVIGRRGRTAQAIRTLVRAAAASEGTDAAVDIVD